MITIVYFHGINRELEEKTGLKHKEQQTNGFLYETIIKILKAKLNIMITHKYRDSPPCHDYIIYIDSGNFKQSNKMINKYKIFKCGKCIENEPCYCLVKKIDKINKCIVDEDDIANFEEIKISLTDINLILNKFFH